MTLTQLEYVLAVYKHKHFGKAAKASFVTQPTLSMQIQKLEEELGIILFDRTKTPIVPTQEGQHFIKQAEVVLQEQRKLLSIVHEQKDEIAGDFKLAVIPTISPYLVPLFACEFVKKYPLLNLQIIEQKTDVIIDLIKEDKIDAALVVTPLHEKNLEERVLYYEPFYLFTSKESPLYKKEAVEEKDLNLKDIWLLDKGHCFREQVLNICVQKKDSSHKKKIEFESGNFETLKNMVLKSSGYTLLPHMALKGLQKSQEKNIRPFKKPVPMREVSLIFNKSSGKVKILDALEEAILYTLPEGIHDFKPSVSQIIEIS